MGIGGPKWRGFTPINSIEQREFGIFGPTGEPVPSGTSIKEGLELVGAGSDAETVDTVLVTGGRGFSALTLLLFSHHRGVAYRRSPSSPGCPG